MTQVDKDTLIAKIDAIKWSIGDVQLQAVVNLILDTAKLLPTDDIIECGFTKSKEEHV